MTLSVPARFQRVGKETRMIIDGIGPQTHDAKPDPSLIKLIVKAHRLHVKLMTENMGIGDIAESQGVHHSYVSRLIRLAFLSPEITEAILDGRQPLGLTATKLMRVSRLPLDWRAQRQALGFSESRRGHPAKVALILQNQAASSGNSRTANRRCVTTKTADRDNGALGPRSLR